MTKGIRSPYRPTPNEQRVLNALKVRRAERPHAPAIKVSSADGKASLSVNHSDQDTGHYLLMDAIGASDPQFLVGLLHQMVNVSSQGREVDEEALNYMLSMVKSIEPRDQLETMLAAQMAAIHNATMTFARRLAHVENIPQQDAAERALNKLARTFTIQIEALKRYRSAGEQTVRVEHVTVNEGGQAIVGNVSHGGRGASRKGRATP